MRISDWSSDVCSFRSPVVIRRLGGQRIERAAVILDECPDGAIGADVAHADDAIERDAAAQVDRIFTLNICRERVLGRVELAAWVEIGQIGSAPCRKRWCRYG